MIEKLRKFFSKENIAPDKRALSPFYDIGFHGDKYLLEVVDVLLQKVDFFIETGTNVGTTLAYVAKNYPEIECISCEPDPDSFESAKANMKGLENITLFDVTSQDLIEILKKKRSDLYDKEGVFWLDAHGYGFKWPLKEELTFITENFSSAYVLVDDFKVPGKPEFIYDVYLDQICSFSFVKGALNPDIEYRVYYPNYKEKSSKHHPLCGWGLIDYGHDYCPGFSVALERKLRGPLIHV